MKLEYSPEDFDFYCWNKLSPAEFAQAANAKLREWLEKAPKVQGRKLDKELGWVMGETPWIGDTHTARLIEIEEI